MQNLTIKKTLLIAASIPVLFSTSCSKSTTTDADIIGDWSRASDFEGVARTAAVSFAVGDTAYVGSGFDGTDRLTDYWALNPVTGTWTQKADMPGAARSSATAFALNGKGYVGTGYDGLDKLKDFYEYNPATNTWTQKADIPGAARYEATAFSVNSKGYIACGFDGNYLKDLWEYDPATNQWTQKASLGGTKRSGASSFVIGGYAYLVGGINNGAYPDDFWLYDQANNTWTQKRKISNSNSDEDFDDKYGDITRSGASSFEMANKGYLLCGNRSGILSSVWEYNPATDLWVQKTSLEASARVNAVAFTIGNAGYITTGSNSTYRFDDLWKFNPDIDQIDNN